MARRSTLLRLAALIPLATFPGALLAPGQAQTADPAPLHIAGTVLNTVTGKPVGHALVASTDNRLATLTDDEGRFSFDLVRPSAPSPATDSAINGITSLGQVAQFRAQKPGFLFDGDMALVSLSAPTQPGNGPGANVLPSTQPAGNVELRLTPTAVIAGTVSADNTDAAADVPVILLRHQVQDGEYTWTQSNKETTDGRGGYRFAGLEPGEYTVMTAEWRGAAPLPQDANAITRQYPPVFFGDTPTLTPTGVLHLLPGETAEADLHLRPATYFPVTIPVATPGSEPASQSGSQPGFQFGGWVNAEVSTPDGLSQFTLGYSNREHAATGALPNGDYTVLLTGARGAPRDASFAVFPLHVAGAPVRTAPVALSSSGNTPVRVRREFTRDHGDQAGIFNVSLTLRPEPPHRDYAGGGNQPGNEDEFFLHNVHPGRYRVAVQAFPGYASAVTSGGIDLLREPLVVGADGTSEPIQVTLRDDGAMLSGTVITPAGAAASRTFLLLLPTSGAGQMLENVAGPDHTFTFNNVVPGAYRLLAFNSRRPPEIAWREPGALRAFDGEGISLTAAPGETLHKDITAIDPHRIAP